jgi:hypothetical protein
LRTTYSGCRFLVDIIIEPLRSLLLDIKLTPNNRPPQSTTVIRMHIQARDGLSRGQNHRQLQLCVPLVFTDGQSYRMKDAQHRKENPQPT